ncbi:hypothetical protein UFOVP32_37 [uncultured Caudovirales phage]|uniref:Uncharacterized protein n=1 Tax=uncultured Caudovirales phage TaxID=2100421 RepID=A0A6J5KLD4_9CAUD|nr:hypothetical protein UFOVP32_37 [uncultured Caudovirales phage]CAB4123670.1 hypothetical protein UFOVP50_39 [uncultured Caudovirales phage]
MRNAERFAGEDYQGARRKGTRFGTLWLNQDAGEGDVTLTLEFVEESPLFRLDVLKDVIYFLKLEYESASKDMRAQYERGQEAQQ